jgi:hypothetical protein
MRTFLVNANKESEYYKKPSCNWGFLKPNTYFEGPLPKGYNLAINPTYGIIVIDVDVDLDKEPFKNGFDNIPIEILKELGTTYNYYTKNTTTLGSRYPNCSDTETPVYYYEFS